MKADDNRLIVELVLSESFRLWAAGEKDDGSWKVHLGATPEQHQEVVQQALLLVRTLRFDTNNMGPEQALRLKKRITESLTLSLPGRPAHRIVMRRWIPYAAVLSILLAAGGFFYWLKTQTDPVPADVPTLTWRSETAEPGVIKKMVLPDGTRITLNAGTTLDYPVPFTDRFVRLDGEAYFDVVHDERHPFRVGAGQVEATVLGTSFNVNTRDDRTEVALISGKVSVQDKELDQTITLQPGKMAIAGEKALTVSNFDQQQVTGWREYVLIYDSEQLETIFRDLERIYGVRIVLKASVDRTTRYTGRFDGEPLDSILKGIGYVSGFSATRKDDEVLVY